MVCYQDDLLSYTQLFRFSDAERYEEIKEDLSNQGHLQFMIIDGRFNSGAFETFLRQMIKYSRQKLYFVTEGHPAHKTKKLNECL